MDVVTFIFLEVCLFYVAYEIGEMVGQRRTYKKMSDRRWDDEDDLK